MNCPDCGRPDVDKKCVKCGWTASTDRAGQEAPKNPHALIDHRCIFRTGSWQCTWGRLAPYSQESVFCPIHAEGLRRGVTSTKDIYRILVDERGAVQENTTPASWLRPEDVEAFKLARVQGLPDDKAILQVKHVPFFWRPLEACWHALTGLPLPDPKTVDEDEEEERPAVGNLPDPEEAEARAIRKRLTEKAKQGRKSA